MKKLTIIFINSYAPPVLRRFVSWASLRTLIVAAGLPFVALSLGGACLDYAGEDWGVEACDTSGDAGTTTPDAGGGSGSGSGIIIPTEDDCVTTTPVVGSGSGSATP